MRCKLRDMLADLERLATVDLAHPSFVALRNDLPSPDDVLASWFRATPQGRVLLALLLDPERGRHALATLLLDPAVADDVRPMVANEPSGPGAPRPAGAEDVLARRFAAVLAAFGEAATSALPDLAECEAIEARLRERVLFAPGLLDLATRRVVVVDADGGPAPADLDALCPELQVVLDAATRADVPARGESAGWDGRRGVRLAAYVAVPDLPDGVTHSPHQDPKAPEPVYQCVEHRDFAVV